MCYNFFGVKSMGFPDIIKYVRKKTGMSQKELAHALNVSFASINRWENGKTRPNRLTKGVFFDYCKKSGIEIREDDTP